MLVRLHLSQFGVEVLGDLLLLLGLALDTRDFRLDLENVILLLLDQLFDGLESLVSLLHTKERFLPVIEQGLLGHDDLLDFDGGLLQGISSSSCLFLLGYELGLVKSLLLVESLDLFVHGVNEGILALLLLFKVNHGLFSSVSCPPCNRNFGLHDLIVLFDLF